MTLRYTPRIFKMSFITLTITFETEDNMIITGKNNTDGIYTAEETLTLKSGNWVEIPEGVNRARIATENKQEFHDLFKVELLRRSSKKLGPLLDTEKQLLPCVKCGGQGRWMDREKDSIFNEKKSSYIKCCCCGHCSQRGSIFNPKKDPFKMWNDEAQNSGGAVTTSVLESLPVNDPNDALPSPNPCPSCTGVMTIGDEKAGDVCSACWMKVADEDLKL
jgi:hypothetical protein